MADIFELFEKIKKKKDAGAVPPGYIIAGLGNPGREYLRTRHNAGFMAVDHICKEASAECDTLKFHSLCTTVTDGDKKILVMKPQTFMNESGIAVGEAARFYKIPPENILVIYDDINFEPGVMRIREKGSAGGHNGMKSIIYHLESDAFPRIRIGVGKKPRPETDLASWVLGEIPKEGFDAFVECLEKVPEAARLIRNGKISDAMGRFNGGDKK